jgi:AcrR family transcriptional regulator
MARTRSEQRTSAFVDATLELLREGGYGRLTMGAVAARAGVGKDTLYRRHRSKADLVHHVLYGRHHTVETEPADTGSLRTDVLRICEDLVAFVTDPVAVEATPQLMADGFADPEALERVRRTHYDPIRAGFATVLARAKARGEVEDPLPPPELVADALTGAVVFRCAFAGIPADPDLAPDLAALVLDGLLPRRT